MHHMTLSFFVVVGSLYGCARPLTEAGAEVELITAPHAQGCEIIQAFSVGGSSYDDILRQVLNRAAELGGDSASIVDGLATAETDYVDAFALRCKES